MIKYTELTFNQKLDIAARFLLDYANTQFETAGDSLNNGHREHAREAFYEGMRAQELANKFMNVYSDTIPIRNKK